MTELDPYAAAMNPQTDGPKTYFGEISTVDLTFYVLKKGQQKRPYDPQSDPQSDARLLIDIRIQPLKGDYEIKQDVFNFSAEWAKHTLPSLQKIGADIRNLPGKFCQIQKVPTGETYMSKDKLDAAGNVLTPGEVKAKTAIVFVAIYDSRDACEAAADDFYGVKPASDPAPAEIDLSDPLRVQAATFLDVIWIASGNNVEKFLNLVTTTEATAKYFNADSPEVIAFTGGSNVPF